MLSNTGIYVTWSANDSVNVLKANGFKLLWTKYMKTVLSILSQTKHQPDRDEPCTLEEMMDEYEVPME
jgi:hypothetical protein